MKVSYPKRFRMGPASLVAAAFIGPGTVTTCTLAGANFGYALLWALLFSLMACMLLQEMSARLGLVTQQGLGEVLKKQFSHPLTRPLVFALVMVAIFIGNGAYEGGNIAGAVLGLEAMLPDTDFPWAVLIVVVAFAVLFQGSYRVFERALIALVLLMSVAFVTTFLLTKPDWPALFQGMKPHVPEGAWLTVVALVGTTVVPYNLFLHASAVKSKWHQPEDLPLLHKDTLISIGIGGLISISIVATAATAFFGQQADIRSAADMSVQLQPLLGSWASVCVAVGLFAAGISSAITAPLAAAYAVAGMMGWPTDGKNIKFKLIWMVVLFSGLLLSLSGYQPITIIWFAQIANGLLLPLLAAFLLYAMNRTDLLGRFKNTPVHNFLGVCVILVALFLGAKSLYFALN
ncbi:manganese transporter [Marinicella pacifica]|uniref:Manganese transporter n=2 Tax=Marinicella pacifica TaxID=1171543 RepID=A0A917CFS3_9GAMM|nr:Nramp family divalent metal transporter [Marinicella pacifica]GGF86556.1 manganese transporter [Marinicella pacifica]